MQKLKLKETEIGLIPEDWEIDILSSKANVNMGQSPKSEYYNQNKEGEKFLQGIRTFGDKYPTFDTYTSKTTKKGTAGSVLFSVRAPVGEVNVTRDDLCIGRGLSAINMKNGNNEFLYYLLKNFKSRILNFENGSVFGSINGQQIKELKFAFPKDNEQKAIAKILSDLDSKIESLQKQNTKLQKIGDNLFKEKVISLEEYEESSLDQIANYLNGLALQKYPSNGKNDLPVIKIRELKQGITSITDKANSNLPKEYIIENGDILFSWSGSLEVVIWCNGKGALNQHLFKVTSDKFPKWFYYYWTLHHLEQFKRIAADKATTMGHIKRKHLTDAKVKIPSPELINNLDKLFAPIIEKQIISMIEIRNLEKIRDSLLPKLMTGKIRVKVNE